MARQNINLGTAPDGAGGDDVRGAFTKTNANFEELYENSTEMSETLNTTSEKVTILEEEVPLEEAQEGISSKVKGWTARRVFDAIKSWTGKNLGEAAYLQADGSPESVLTSTNSAPDGIGWRGGWYKSGADGGSGVRPYRATFTIPYSMESQGWNGTFISFSIDTGEMTINGIRRNNYTPLRRVYDTVNTTTASDGSLKVASPIIKLFNNKHEIENESEFGLTPSVVKLSTGTYEITNTLGLRSDSWFLDTPQDLNGNKYFNVDYEQTTGTVVDGVLDAGEIDSLDDLPKLDPSTVIIKCFERVWNPKTGIFENGDPVDIKDGRYITLRFNELQYTIKPTDHESVAKGKK